LDRTLEALERAAAASPGDAVAEIHLARAYQRLGRQEEAFFALLRARWDDADLSASLRRDQLPVLCALPPSQRRRVRLAGSPFADGTFESGSRRRGIAGVAWRLRAPGAVPTARPRSLASWLGARAPTGPALGVDLRKMTPSASGPTIERLNALPCLRRVALARVSSAAARRRRLRGRVATVHFDEPTDAALAVLEGCPARTLELLGATEATRTGIARLRSSPRLEAVHLSHPGDRGPGLLAALGSLPRLRRLDLELGNTPRAGWDALGAAPVTHLRLLDPRLQRLPALPLRRLVRLELRGCRWLHGLTGGLASAPTVSELDLAETALGPAGVASLCRLPLTKLSLDGTRAGDADLAQVARIPTLTELSLVRCPIGDEALRHLATHAQGLRRLDVSGCGERITDAGLHALARLPALTHLWLRGVRVDERGLAPLRERDVGGLPRPGVLRRRRSRPQRRS